MKPFIVILSLLFSTVIAFSQDDQMSAIGTTTASTFNFYGDKLTGTCFMMNKEGKQYFVTAAHLFESSHNPGDFVPVKMLVQNELQSFKARVYFHTNRKVDIAIFTLSEKISQSIEVPEEYARNKEALNKLFQSDGISQDSLFLPIGAEVFFYGFPLGNLGTEVFGIRLPLVKKAVVSGWVKNNGIDLLLLDGHNNLGFSGGPILAYNTLSKKMCVEGVISGYLPEPVDARHKNETLSINENSGIVSYGRRYIDDIFIKYKEDFR